ncbi:MAG: iron-containing redox enzyme family protein [Deltaproteobacteria bacterium]|nr:iron-containing redox enzyme family protein [Deltaproteobacteria bacterium]
MEHDAFREALLEVMEAKVHWAWPAFTRGEVPAERLHIHLEQEYGTYVRDFAVLLGRAYVQCPIEEVRCDLAENLYEEETGRLTRGRPHADLFLEYPRGLAMDLSRFQRVSLLPESADYRAALDAATTQAGWALATAVTTIFVEGTPYERGELDPESPRRPEPPLEQHPLVVHYGLPLSSLALTKVHRMVEGDHRAAAWRMVLEHIPVSERAVVVEGMRTVLERWHAYRDAVALACGLQRPSAPAA